VLSAVASRNQENYVPSVQTWRWIFSGSLCGIFLAASFCPAWTQGAAFANGAASYRQRAALGIRLLQAWYDPTTGLYRTTGWWNSANAITTLADYAQVTGDKQYAAVFPNTLAAAQRTSAGFLNNYYDDEGWWALAWIAVYDVTRDPRYLDMAASIFEDMTKGWDQTCSGGIWWSKERKYKNAIANELFLSVAAHLLTRQKNRKQQDYYLDWANREWQWFSHSGMINSDHLINDGLDAHCANNRQTTWSYNQGVILGGLSELYARTHSSSLLSQADSIAAATLASPVLTDAHGILHDSCEPNCGADGTQFKGIFIRNLAALDRVSSSSRHKAFLLANADRIWAGMKPPDYGIGVVWTVPYETINASTQSSGADALVAAASAVSKSE
jgi:predicted alpha-1,6-mannanase (GH76 family)